MKHFACAFALVWSYHVVRADEPPPRTAAESPSHDQRSADSKTSILFEIQIAEVSRAKLAADVPGEAPAGSLIERLTTDGDTRRGARGILSESGKKLFDKLRSQGALKVIAEPSIVTIAGRPASMHVGGELPVPASDGNRKSRVRYLRYGTSIDVVPIVLGDEKLRLELRLQLSHLDFANSIELDGQEYPGLVGRRTDFATEIAVGQTMVVILPPETKQAGAEDGIVAGEPSAPAKNEAVETLVLVTPRGVDSMEPLDKVEGGLDVPMPRAARFERDYYDVPSHRARR